MTDETTTADPKAGDLVSPQTGKQIQDLILTLNLLDQLARERGHSLEAMLVKLARDSFGIDIMPPPPEPSPEELAAMAAKPAFVQLNTTRV